MLEQNDLQVMAELIDIRVTKTEVIINDRMDALETTLNKKIKALNKKINDIERTFTNELVRTEDILTRRMNEIQKDIEEIKQYYRINKLENGNVS